LPGRQDAHRPQHGRRPQGVGGAARSPARQRRTVPQGSAVSRGGRPVGLPPPVDWHALCIVVDHAGDAGVARGASWEDAMHWDTVKGNWNQMKGKVRSKWGELTDVEVAQMKGDRDQLIGKIQERYGKTKEEAEREVNEF